MPVCQGKWGEAGPVGEGIVPTTPLLLFYSKTAQAADTAGVTAPSVPCSGAQRLVS